MRTLILAGLLLASSAFAECTYYSENAKVTWKAYKTYEKIGVGGSFDRAVFSPKSAKTIEEFLTGSHLNIDTSSVNSGNPGRDATLVASFFKIQNVESIAAKIISAKDSKALVEITMNGVTKSIPMSYGFQEGKIVGKGVIDLSDFAMLKSLQSITTTCFNLHGGKTWQDVEIGFEIPIANNCY
jgi:polyisoprenoid-binding protein YceI